MVLKMSERKGISSLLVVGIVIIAIVVVVGLYYAFTTPGIIKPNEVMLTGSVTTTGTGTTPLQIKFTSINDNTDFYQINCVGGGNPASYTINLPNQRSYRVTITWRGLLFNTGDTDVGRLDLDTFDTSLTHDWAG